jgi:hypothetical protein
MKLQLKTKSVERFCGIVLGQIDVGKLIGVF